MPDVFGIPSPEEQLAKVRERFAARRAEFLNSNASASPGAQVGQSLANIFAPTVQRALDTSVARREERNRLLETGQALTKKQAREMARMRISPEFKEVREAKRMQQVTSRGRGVIDQLIEEGMPAARARAVGMLTVARDLEGSGFEQEATQMRIQAAELLEAQEKEELALAQAEATLQSTLDENQRANLKVAADDDTFARYTPDGGFEFTSAPLTDIEGRQDLREQGYINIGNSNLFDFQLGPEELTGNKPLPQHVQENMQAAFSMMHGLDILERVEGSTGIFKGPLTGAQVFFGFGSQDEVDARAVVDKMKADIQSLVKGIPSNYDASLFEKMVPDPFRSQSDDVYRARVDLLREETRRALELNIAYYMGTDRKVPTHVLNVARRYGANVDAIDPITSEEQLDRLTNAHEDQIRLQLDALDEQDGLGPVRLETPEDYIREAQRRRQNAGQ